MTPVIHKICNVSVKSSPWPSSRKRANVIPSPKVDMPKDKTENRGINISRIISCAFENSVYSIHARDVVEQAFLPSLLTARKGGICEEALLCVQHEIYSYLTNPN